MDREEILSRIQEAKNNQRIFLSLTNLELSKLPQEVVYLFNLRRLSLSGNHLSELPKEIVFLSNLHSLSLNKNQFYQLPKEVIQLSNLQSLYLNENQLLELPNEIDYLSRLKRLSINHNQLRELPKEIGLLFRLRDFFIKKNKLHELPKEIGQLSNLQILNLSENQLSELPKEIFQLTSLQTLSLAGNQLNELPKEISQLTNLQKLYLDENQLRGSADLLLSLKNITLFVSDGKTYNPIGNEILSRFQSGQALLDYYFKPREIKLNEAKILLIGQGNVGKTSLRQRLMNEKSYGHKGRTEGVEIFTHYFDIHDETIKINFWDFGGQEIYHTTHQFFFRSRCLYILVIDARLGERASHLNYWLRQTQALGNNAPVIVVINKAELHEKDEIDERYKEIRTKIHELRKQFPNIFESILISCDKNIDIGILWLMIAEAIELRIPEIGTKITKEEAEVIERIENETGDYISDERFQEICKDVPQERKKDLFFTLDAIGKIVSFDDPVLRNTKVLKPEWITKGIYKILSSYKLGEKNGKVQRQEIQEIFQSTEEDRQKYPPDKIEYILEIMEKHDLCYSESIGRGKKQLLFPVSFTVKEAGYSIFPANSTHFEYKYNHIFFDSIIVRFLKFAYMTYGEEGNNYWRKGAIINRGKNRILVKADEIENKITIKIDGVTGTRRELLKTITDHFDKIHEDFGDLQEEKRIFYNKRNETYKFDYETVINREERGEDFITLAKESGEEAKISIKYLLDGIEPAEIIEENIGLPVVSNEVSLIANNKVQNLTEENLKLRKINKLMDEIGEMKANKSGAESNGWLILLLLFLLLIVIIAVLLIALTVYKFIDWQKPETAVVLGLILAAIPLLPLIIGFIMNFFTSGDEKKKKNYITLIYGAPLRFINSWMYGFWEFVERDYEDKMKELGELEKSGVE